MKFVVGQRDQLGIKLHDDGAVLWMQWSKRKESCLVKNVGSKEHLPAKHRVEKAVYRPRILSEQLITPSGWQDIFNIT